MADFLNSVQNNITGNTKEPGKQLLNTGIDRDRNNFLRGLKTTTSGQKEDPTYLGFRLLFDFNIGSNIDEETFLPISPILCDSPNMKLNLAGSGMDLFSISKYIRNRVENPSKIREVANVTNDMYYYSALGYLQERRSLYENDHNNASSYRHESLRSFQTMVKSINEKSPWFIQSIDGLNSLLAIPQNRSYPGNQVSNKSNRSGKLVFNCLDSIDLRTTAMADFYRKATYDANNMRSLVPQNLRKFRMWIIVTELRNIHLDRNILDVLNPFNISAVSNVASMVSDIAQSAGINSNNPGSTADQPNKLVDDSYSRLAKLEPYIFMYQLDQCEFDFDEYTHIPQNLSNADNRKPVDNKFAIHVGKITEKKLQYNILSDLIANKTQFSSILIADSWNMDGSMLGSVDYNVNNDGNLFGRLANNFINNSVSSVVQQYSPIVGQAILGNAYGFQLNDIERLSNSVQDAVSGIGNLKSPFQDFTPQAQGLGGPNERAYPTLIDDVYKNNVIHNNSTLGSVYNGNNTSNTHLNEDAYNNVPGKDLGLPDRMYPSIIQDNYLNDPGKDLGVPDRVYKKPNNDVYPTDPGPDLGLPGRVYPHIQSDNYTGVPGGDLGVPNRVYPPSTGDAYPTDPGVDLGLPGRVYPNIISDNYPNVPGSDLGEPNRVYPPTNDDVYPTDPTPDLGLPGRVYPNIISDNYPNVPGSDLGEPNRVYPPSTGDVYPTDPTPDLGLPGRVYPGIINDQYSDVPGKDLGVSGRNYQTIIDDVYNEGINKYDQIKSRVYPGKIDPPKTPTDDVYSDVPGKALGGTQRDYPTINKKEY